MTPRLFACAALLVFSACLAACATAPGPAARTADTIDAEALWQQYRDSPKARRLKKMLDEKAIVVGQDTMPLHTDLIWDEGEPMPDAGYPVFISMHGGGALTAEENREQWVKQYTRYPGVRGLYVCPHSPMDTWDQWHHERIFKLIDTLVQALMLRDDIDPNRIYLNGYCSGGNGVYQLGPILADRFAACSATKAYGEGAPLANLRNLPIDLQWGEHDREPLGRPAHNRDNVQQLLEMHREDPDGYAFRDIEHWRQGKIVNDKSTMRWMSRYTRNPYPQRVVWQQDGDVRDTSNPPRHRMHWLGVEQDYGLDGTTDFADARIDAADNTIHITASGYGRLLVFLNDQMLDLTRPVRVVVNGEQAFEGRVAPSAQVVAREFAFRGDRGSVYSVCLPVDINSR